MNTTVEGANGAEQCISGQVQGLRESAKSLRVGEAGGLNSGAGPLACPRKSYRIAAPRQRPHASMPRLEQHRR
jgi:hypothetical protein